MKDVQFKSVQIGGYLRILAIAIALICTLVFGSKAFAMAPHLPDMGLQAEVDMHRQCVEKAKDRKAADKVNKYKDHKIKDKGNRDKIKEKASGKKKGKKHVKIKKTKPPKPSKADRKRAKRDNARNLH